MARPDVRANRYSAPLPCDNNISMARLLLLRAKRPLIYAGGGILLANAVSEFRDFLSTTGIPCVETLKALGSCGRLYAANLGMLGMHGSRAANLAVAHCDVLLCIGVRFDDRATGRLDTFAPHAQIIQLDCDQAEIGKLRQPDLALTGHLPAILPRLEAELSINDW